jgi:repressor LexA
MVNKDSKLFYFAVGNNIKKYRKNRNLSLQALGEKVGVTKKTISRYENGEIKVDMSRLADIATAMNLDVSKLLDGTEKFLGLGFEDIEQVRLPVVGKISCGNGNVVYEEVEAYEVTPKEWLNGGEYFYLRAKGDSMTGARINDGDLLLIRRQQEVEDGEIAAVVIEDEAVLKRVYKQEGTLILQSENQNYPPVVITEGQVKIVGKLKKVVINFT